MKNWTPLEQILGGVWAVGIFLVIGMSAQLWYGVQNDRRRQLDLDRVASLIESYYFTHFEFPTASDGLITDAAGPHAWGSSWSPYTGKLPQETDLARPPYCYRQAPAGFQLFASAGTLGQNGPYTCNGAHYSVTVSHSYQ